MSDLQSLTIEAIQNAYSRGLETPTSLILKLRQQALAQAEFNPWITLLSEEELGAYLDALKLKPIASCPLWGIPFAIKDNIDLAEVPTSAACEAFTYVPEKSATVTSRLIEAGAIPLGKTNLDQFATGLVGTRSPFGEGKNVFNPDYISGGSSAGSAIATALGQVSFALGTDTAGSGRVPAAFNNLIGHKPTKGLISSRGVVPACKSLDSVSIFGLTAGDVAAVLDVAIGDIASEADPYSRENHPFNTAQYWSDATPNAFEFGVPDELNFDGDSEAEALFRSTCQTLEALGGIAVTIKFAPFLSAARLLYEGPWVAERVWATQHVAADAMLPVIQAVLATSKNFDVIDVFDAQYKLQALKKACDQEVARVDFILTPTAPTCYLRADINKDPIALNSKLGTYTNFMNLLDYAATAVSVGKLSTRVSWGVTLFSAAFTDVRLLSYAGALQRRLKLKLGATAHSLASEIKIGRIAPEEFVDVVVCGAHLDGQPLNWQLRDRHSVLKKVTKTAANYALYALPDGKRPALVPVGDQTGSEIEVEVWRMPMAQLGSFVAGIPSPLGIGKVTLESGENLSGFICEEGGITGAEDISRFGSWRSYLAATNKLE